MSMDWTRVGKGLRTVVGVAALVGILAACGSGTTAAPRPAPTGTTVAPLATATTVTKPTTAATQPAPTNTPRPAATAPAQGETKVEGPLWKLDSYLGSDGKTATAVADVKATMEFQDGRVSGNASCNRYTAGYTVSGNKLTIQPATVTKMACINEAVNKQEMAFLAALGQVASFQVTGNQLKLANAAGQTVLTFSVLPPTSLVGSTWHVLSYNNGKGGLVSTQTSGKITVVFGADGRVSGFAGCNTYGGSYQVTGDTLKLSQLAATAMACEPSLMQEEQEYLAALGKAVSLRIQDDTLELLDASGTRMVTYKAR